MTIEELAEALNTELAVLLPDLGADAKLLGQEHLQEYAGAMRLVWVPLEDDFRRPEGQGMGVLYTAGTMLAAHLRGPNTTELLKARDAVINAIHNVTKGHHKLRGGSWEGKNGGGMTAAGVGYILGFTVDLPIMRADRPAQATVSTTVVHGPTFGPPPS